MGSKEIFVGYEVNTGKSVFVPLGHTAVTGQTQQSGKTTALEALGQRSKAKVIAFVTKRGELSFDRWPRIQPYFQERIDWEFVASLLESVRKEKMRFERAWIVKACKGATKLSGVLANTKSLAASSKRSMDQDMYMLLGEYLEKVVPTIEKFSFAWRAIDPKPGIQVMDLSSYSTEIQALIIRSVLAWVYKSGNNVITVIPESWEFLPEHRRAPVQMAAVDVVRKGAALGNFIWLDSQDIAGVSKEILKQVSVWLLGVQREANEIKRTLAHIPAGVKRPKADDVASLRLGEFFVCRPGEVVRTYVQPIWMTSTVACGIALGTKPWATPSMISENRSGKPVSHGSPRPVTGDIDTIKTILATTASDFAEFLRRTRDEFAADLRREAETIRSQLAGEQKTPPVITKLQASAPYGKFTKTSAAKTAKEPTVPRASSPADGWPDQDEAFYQRLKARLLSELPDEPRLLKVLVTRPQIEIEVRSKVIEVDGDTTLGRVALMLKDGWFGGYQSANGTWREAASHGLKVTVKSVYNAMEELLERGFLYKNKNGYKAVPEMIANVNVKESE